MSQSVPYLIQGKNIILVVDGKSHTVNKDTHIGYAKILEAIKDKNWDALRDLVVPAKVFVNFGNGHVTIDDDQIMWKGKPFHNSLATRMIEMMQEGFPVTPMVRFMENLMANPSTRSVEQVYGFLEKNNLPITEDGHFLAFKKVSKHYMDIHSNTISNRIGESPTMDRNEVNDNPDQTCSSGLHFCSISYLSSFGSSTDPVMVLKINPADVVSIPTDYNGAKGRCSKYTVVAEVTGDPAQAFTSVIAPEYASVQDVNATAPADVWPFPTGAAPVAAKVKAKVKAKALPKAPAKAQAPTTNMYDVRRRGNSETMARKVTYSVAAAMVAKNVRQKKAQLKIVKTGTNIEIEV